VVSLSSVVVPGVVVVEEEVKTAGELATDSIAEPFVFVVHRVNCAAKVVVVAFGSVAAADLNLCPCGTKRKKKFCDVKGCRWAFEASLAAGLLRCYCVAA
jgi:CDGSH-type Zn-finger protein